MIIQREKLTHERVPTQFESISAGAVTKPEPIALTRCAFRLFLVPLREILCEVGCRRWSALTHSKYPLLLGAHFPPIIPSPRNFTLASAITIK
jgi:hypothetical protein